jgi:hypothetical protein
MTLSENEVSVTLRGEDQGLSQLLSELTRNISEFGKGSEQAEASAKALSDALSGIKESQEGVTKTGNEVNSYIREQNRLNDLGSKYWKATHDDLYDAAAVMQDVSNIANRALGMFQQYNVMQIRLTQAAEAQSNAQERVATAQNALNAAIQQYGPNSVQAQKASEDLAKAQEQLATAQDRYAQAQQQSNLQLVGFALAIPGVFTQLLNLSAHLHEFPGIISMFTGGFSSAIGAISSVGSTIMSLNPILLIIGAAIGVFVALWTTNLFGFRDTVMAAIDAIVGFFKGLWDALSGIGKAISDWFGWLTGGTKKACDDIRTIPAEADRARRNLQMGMPNLTVKISTDPNVAKAQSDYQLIKNANPSPITINVTTQADIPQAQRTYKTLAEQFREIKVPIKAFVERGVEGVTIPETLYKEPAPTETVAGLKAFQFGGPVLETGPAFLHAGEFVLPRGFTFPQGEQVIINNYVSIEGPIVRKDEDIDKLASAVSAKIAERWALRGRW